MKPHSITLFDRFYLGALLIGLANSLIHWDEILATPEVVEAGWGSGFFIFSMMVGFGISLLLWFFVSQKGSSVAKWILVVLTVIGLIGVPLSLGGISTSQMILTLATTALQIAAAVMLFRADAKPWFEKSTVDPSTFD